MTAALPARDFLPDKAPIADWVQHQLPEMPQAKGLAELAPGVAWNTVAEILATKIDELLAMDLARPFVKLWIKHDELQTRAGQAKDGELVALVEHQMTSSHKPRVEVWLSRTRVMNVELELQLQLRFEGVQLQINAGAVKKVHLGRVFGQTMLAIHGQRVLEQPMGELELPGEVEFSPPVALSEIALA
jgi:hypothetical protein